MCKCSSVVSWGEKNSDLSYWHPALYSVITEPLPQRKNDLGSEAASCPAVWVQPLSFTDRGINFVASSHLKNDTWLHCNLLQSNKQRHTQSLQTPYKVLNGYKPGLLSTHYVNYRRLKDVMRARLVLLTSKLYSIRYSWMPKFMKMTNTSHTSSKLQMLYQIFCNCFSIGWEKNSTSLFVPICRDFRVHHTEAQPIS